MTFSIVKGLRRCHTRDDRRISQHHVAQFLHSMIGWMKNHFQNDGDAAHLHVEVWLDQQLDTASIYHSPSSTFTGMLGLWPYWMDTDWTSVLFTALTLHWPCRHIRVWRIPNKWFTPICIDQHDCYSEGSVMVWTWVSVAYHSKWNFDPSTRL